MSFMMILMLFIMWPRAIVAAGRVNEVLETNPTIINPENPKQFIEQGTIEFRMYHLDILMLRVMLFLISALVLKRVKHLQLLELHQVVKQLF